MRRGVVLLNNNVAGSYWDVEHFQHSYGDKETQHGTAGSLKQWVLVLGCNSGQLYSASGHRDTERSTLCD